MKDFTVTRKFRGATYEIEVKNPNGATHGVKSLTIDGKEITGNLIPLAAEGSLVHVTAVLQ